MKMFLTIKWSSLSQVQMHGAALINAKNSRRILSRCFCLLIMLGSLSWIPQPSTFLSNDRELLIIIMFLCATNHNLICIVRYFSVYYFHSIPPWPFSFSPVPFVLGSYTGSFHCFVFYWPSFKDYLRWTFEQWVQKWQLSKKYSRWKYI